MDDKGDIMKLDGAPFTYDDAFSALVEAGYELVESDFDEMTFKKWRQKAIDCISSLLGPDHPYTRSFSEHVRRHDPNNLFLGRGLIDATRQDVLTKMKRPGKESRRQERLLNP